MPHVNSVSLETIAWFAVHATYFRVVSWDDTIVGFLVALTPDADYTSSNFLWFRDRYSSFVYIDRIVVAPSARRRGIARRLYEDVQTFAQHVAPALTCEVNIRPRNDASVVFHREFGFKEVGQQITEGGNKTVSLLLKSLDVEAR